MRISDWSSDVCSSDLILQHFLAVVGQRIDGESAEVGKQLRRRETRIEQNSRVAEFGRKMRSGKLRRKMFGPARQAIVIPQTSAPPLPRFVRNSSPCRARWFAATNPTSPESQNRMADKGQIGRA